MMFKRKIRKNCFHHERPAWSDGKKISISWIIEEIIDFGRKRYECSKCGKVWII